MTQLPETTETDGPETDTGHLSQVETNEPQPGRWTRFVTAWGTKYGRRLIIGWAVYIALSLAYLATEGIPYSTDVILIWITVGIIVSSLGGDMKWKKLIRDWLPLYFALALYALLRGYASHVFWGPFYRPQVWLDKLVGGGTVPTVRLQHWLWHPNDLHFYDYVVWLCYLSHFFTSFIIAAYLWRTNYPKFKRFVPLFVTLTAMGYVTYVFYPALPPWLAGLAKVKGNAQIYLAHPVIQPVARIIPAVFNHVGVHSAAALFAGGNRFDNNIAAMPSLHCAYPMLILLFFWKSARTRLRIILVAYPLLMAFTLMYTGEHFFTDELLGVIYAILVYFVGSNVLDRIAARRARRQGLSQAAIQENDDIHDERESVTTGVTSDAVGLGVSPSSTTHADGSP